MLDLKLARTALELPPADRLELARQLIESVVTPLPFRIAAVYDGIHRIEDVLSGRVAGLSEAQYRATLK